MKQNENDKHHRYLSMYIAHDRKQINYKKMNKKWQMWILWILNWMKIQYLFKIWRRKKNIRKRWKKFINTQRKESKSERKNLKDNRNWITCTLYSDTYLLLLVVMFVYKKCHKVSKKCHTMTSWCHDSDNWNAISICRVG